MKKKVIVRKDSYYDSVFLMQVTAALKEGGDFDEVQVAMGTSQNKDLIKGLGFDEGLEAAGPNDLIIAVSGKPGAVEGIESKVDRLLEVKGAPGGAGQDAFRPAGIEAAVKALDGANLAVISLPGEYAAMEAARALDLGLHVMLFSDNVPVEEEKALKKKSVEEGLLLMGPDCGTAVINGKPLCFANEIRRGPVGVVAASGTGAQEVSVLVDRMGSGCSQVIGTGGRDLKSEVGGLTALQAVEALDADPDTKVVVVISKPPSEDVAGKLLARLSECGKPAVVHFIASALEAPEGVYAAPDLEAAAIAAVAAANGRDPAEAVSSARQDEELSVRAAEVAGRLAPGRKYVRGYFTGGTLCDEALFILGRALPSLRSNVHHDEELRMRDPLVGEGHCLVDLGDDVFTRGRPHPMIEPSTRSERMTAEARHGDVALVIFDVVLGHGSHHDPAGALLQAVDAMKSAPDGGPVILASVVGTERDYQGFSGQVRKLEEHGVVVLSSNARMSRFALAVIEAREASQ